MPKKKKVKPRKTASSVPIWCGHDAVERIDKLVPNPNNPNRHPEEQLSLLSRLIQEHGWRNPITVSKRSGMIVRGHGRYQAAIMIGLKSAPVDYQDYPSEEAEVLDLIADNTIAEFSMVDKDLAVELIENLGDSDIDLGLAGLIMDLENEQEDQADPGGGEVEAPEVKFTEELTESSNYIVLYFDNDIDWLQAQTLFNLKTVKALDSKEGDQKQGIGRVINGAEALNRILGAL